MEKLALLKLSGVGMTDYILAENIRDICDLCVASAGILLIAALIYCKRNYAN